MVLYKEYIEANLIIPGLPKYNEDVLFLDVFDNKYGKRVPEQIGTLFIDHLVATITIEKLQQDGDTQKQVHLSTVISRRNTVKSLNIPEYYLEGSKGKIHMIREVVISPLMTVVVKGVVKLITHSKCMNGIVEAIISYLDHAATARSYSVLRPGVDKVNMCLRNHSAKQITLPKQTAVGEVAVANASPSLLALKPTEKDVVRDETTSHQRQSGGQKEPLETNWSHRFMGWSLNGQKGTGLIVEYVSIFVMQDIDLGKNSLVRNSIRLIDNTPFKEQY